MLGLPPKFESADARKPVIKISVSTSYTDCREKPKERWEKDLRQAISLNVEHISAYHLIYEEDTPIYNMLKQHQICEVDEDSGLEFFTLLIEYLQKAGYEHYEISNFCRPGYYSRHNTSYWKGIPYLGCRTFCTFFQWNNTRMEHFFYRPLYKVLKKGNGSSKPVSRPTTRYNEFTYHHHAYRMGYPP